MLTKSQATAVADALVEGGKAERIARLQAGAARIPSMYQSHALSRIPAGRQTQLVAQARRSAGLSWTAAAFVGCLVLLVAVCVAVFWFSSEHIRLGATFWLLLPVVAAFAALFRVVLVKLRLQDLLLEELAPRQRDGS